MKIIKYNLCTIVDYGSVEAPMLEEVLSAVEMPWNEVNEEIAKAEAYNGEYIIEDDAQVDPVTNPTQEERIAELEEALNMLLNGVTE
jgi:hypothetical protein